MKTFTFLKQEAHEWYRNIELARAAAEMNHEPDDGPVVLVQVQARGTQTRFAWSDCTSFDADNEPHNCQGNRSGMSWNRAEEKQVIFYIEQGYNYDEIAKKLKRTPLAIRSRMVLMMERSF